MEYIAGIRRAIGYIEAHLAEAIDPERVAAEAAMSPFYFQRIFGILCGVTLGEYIRSRRLSLAGMELAKQNGNIIDVALKYGYETPESFARAFARFHGVSPRAAKAHAEKLRYFSRLSIHISLQGGKTMDYQIIRKPPMHLTGYRAHFTGVPPMGRSGPSRRRRCSFPQEPSNGSSGGPPGPRPMPRPRSVSLPMRARAGMISFTRPSWTHMSGTIFSTPP